MDRTKIIVFPGCTEVGLEIWKSLKDCKDIALYSAASVPGHAPYVFKNHFLVPEVSGSEWVGVLNEIIREYAIDYIFPAYDDVIVALAENRGRLAAKLVSSPLETCLITRSKSRVYETFGGLLPVPKVFTDLGQIDSFPVFVKPDKGQGSQDARRVDDMETLARLKGNPALIVLEYLHGKEYTVDCLSDRDKGLMFCSGRERLRVRSGISMNSRPANPQLQKLFREYALVIGKTLKFHGAWFFQLKQDAQGAFKLLEIAPRISGAMATHRVLGVNFALLSIYEQERLDFEIMTNNIDVELDRSLANRYKHNLQYETVYVDWDDTVLADDRLNTQLIRFLYQAVNQGCKIVLLTRTVSDIDSALKRWKLTGFFDEVIRIDQNEPKSARIDPKNAIFIDDSFKERKNVSDVHKIPTFDCSMLELLINDRI